MKSYRYTQLYISGSGVLLHSTDSQVLDWILAELKKVISNFRVPELLRDTLPSGEKCSLCIDKLQNKDLSRMVDTKATVPARVGTICG